MLRKIAYKIILLINLFVMSWGGYAQNLVRNGSFEFFSQCPDAISQIQFAHGWSDPSLGSADFFNSCAPSSSNASVPSNIAGNQIAHNGVGYSGIYTYATNYREFIQNELVTPLVNGKQYFFEMYLSLSDLSLYASGKTGIYFSKDKIYDSTYDYLNYVPQIVISEIITETDVWVRVTGCYTSKGGEQYMIIGNFNDSINTPVNKVRIAGNRAYYYVDDVSLQENHNLLSTSNLPLLGKDTFYCGSDFHFPLSAMRPHIASYQWSTGDSTPGIVADTSGIYWVRLSVDSNCLEDYIDTLVIRNAPYPLVNLGNDTLICNFNAYQLKAPVYPGAIYKWQSGFINNNWFASSAGIYWVDVTVDGCTTRDSILIDRAAPPIVNLGADTITCLGKTMLLFSTPTYSIPLKYTWNTNDTMPILFVNNPGIYWLEINNKGCIKRDSINIYQFPFKRFALPDTTVCSGIPFYFDATCAGATGYIWNTNAITPIINANTSGLYWAEASNGVCFFRDSAILQIKQTPSLDLPGDTTICENATLFLDAGFMDSSTYLWNKGDTGRYYVVNNQGFYSVTVNRNGCMVSDSLIVNTLPPPPLELGPDTMVCEGSTFVLNAFSSGSTYKWQDNTVNPIMHVSIGGLFKVTVIHNVCKVSDSINVTFVTIASNSP